MDAISCNLDDIPSSTIKLQLLSQQIPSTFNDYISTLDEWEQELLEKATLLPGIPWNQVVLALQQLDIIFASNGSDRQYWYIWLDYGNTIHRHPTHRKFRMDTQKTPSSYYSEIYGALSVSRFLLCFLSFHNLTLSQPPK